ncbi:TerC family protein [Hoeflea prorocentri]|uniref:Tellurium resistance protein TerC n=1 Tax=Hoeflea prorocentri TaxID=1922333 RepID=A0A9X3ZGL9_9HYPH|nr:tellurium resistance protein TerC [Hoeflea prorocentri]MCY6379875.1 tellurium resistance protein TerC [Hoeflea prorocentri]MDA5397675.1 tellurium resistance protein TerC [Hoeflea prorocentri]
MLETLFTLDNLTTFLVLTALETVLGFDNLLYISIEAKQVDPAQQSWVRRVGITLAIVLRIVLLFAVLQLIAMLQAPLFTVNHPWFSGAVSGHSLIVLAGGIFLIYTAMKEIYHMIGVDDLEHQKDAAPRRSVRTALIWIVAMNLVFSFDTVLSAVALTENFIVMTAAIVVSGALMVLMADKVASFLQKNRMYEVLGLFVLLLVGVMLMSDGGHIGHLAFFGHAIEPMAKSTFYFVLVTLVAVEIVQSRYQKRILLEAAAKRREARAHNV